MAMRRSLRAAAWSVAALLLAAALGSSALAARPAALGARLRAAAAASDVALSRWPLVMAHDAATVYLDRGSVLHPVHAWAKTQDSAEGVAGLLRCGARSVRTNRAARATAWRRADTTKGQARRQERRQRVCAPGDITPSSTGAHPHAPCH